MHPLKIFLNSLKSVSASREEFNQKKEELAQEVGVSWLMFHRIYNPKQKVNLSEAKALRLELATGGRVPAGSANERIDEILELAERVIAQRNQAARVLPITKGAGQRVSKH